MQEEREEARDKGGWLERVFDWYDRGLPLLVPSRAIMHNRGEGGSSWPVATSTCCTTNRRIARRRETTAPFKRPFPGEGGEAAGHCERKRGTEPGLGSDFRRFAPLEKPDLVGTVSGGQAIVHRLPSLSPPTFSRYWISMDRLGDVVVEGRGSTGESTTLLII